MMDVPLKEAALRPLFVELNPQAFPRGLSQRLPAGTPIQIPAVADLRPYLARTLAQTQGAADPQAAPRGGAGVAAASVTGPASAASAAMSAAPRAGSGGSWATPVAAARPPSSQPPAPGTNTQSGPGTYPPGSIVQNSPVVVFNPMSHPPGHSQVPWGPAWGPSRNAPAHQGWVRFP